MSAKPAQKTQAPKETAKEAPKVKTEVPVEAPKKVTKAPKEAPKEAAKEAAKEVPKEAAKEAPKKVLKKADAPKPAVADASKPEEGPGRIQLANVLHINISQARCATHLKQHLGDETIEAQVKALRGELKLALEKGDAAGAAGLREKVAAAGKALVRISSETPIAVAVVWDSAVKELLRYGMDRAIAADRKIVDVTHLHEGDAAGALTLGPLYAKCQLWAGFNAETEVALKKDKAAPKDETEPEAEEESSKNSFYTYVENSLKTVKKEEAYKAMRVSNRVREYVAELVTQGIGRNTALSRIIVQRIVGARTMNADHVKVVVNMLMTDAGRRDSEIEAITKQIDEKLALYHGHLQGERAKKSSALSPEEKSAIAQKIADSSLARKKKQAEALRKRAVESANASKALTAEVLQLEAAKGSA